MDKGVKMNKEKLKEKIPDFARKIAPMYFSLEWKWYMDGKYVVPDVLDIAEALNMLLDNLGEGQSVSTGGLSISHDKEDNTFIMDFTVGELVCLDE